MIRDIKLKYNINREAAKISALSSKIDKISYKGILLSDKSRRIEQAKFTYSPLWKAFEKQMKTEEENKLKPQSFNTRQRSKRPKVSI